MKLPLSDVKVLSAARLLPGAYCTSLLADLGADVVMLEQPGSGDPMRNKPSFFSALCRGKASLTLDLKQTAARKICYEMVARSDVFIESSRPGVAVRLEIDYPRLREINPRLVYVSISGFGQNGPYAKRPGHDLMFQGITGMLASQLTAQKERFVQPMVPVADLSSGMFAAISILAALKQAREMGEGQYLDISMTDGLVSWMSIWLNGRCKLDSQPVLAGYGIFEGQDGKFIALGVDEEPHFWKGLCRTIGREDLAGLSVEERKARYAELNAILKGIFLTRRSEEWLKMLVRADVPASPVYTTTEEIIRDEQLTARGLFAEEGNEVIINSPLPGTRKSESASRPPAVGEQTVRILAYLGHNQQEIDELKAAGAI